MCLDGNGTNPPMISRPISGVMTLVAAPARNDSAESRVGVDAASSRLVNNRSDIDFMACAFNEVSDGANLPRSKQGCKVRGISDRAIALLGLRHL